MLKISIQKTKLLAFAILFCCGFSVSAQVSKYGLLKINNGKVSDKDGNPVQLRGTSLFWSGYPEGSPFYNDATIGWLKTNLCINVVRAAMSFDIGDSKYQNNPDAEYAKIKTVIQSCIARDIYVIVDFHTHSINQAAAISFYQKVISDFPNTPNLLFEPFNEPIYQSWTDIRSYHNAVVAAIRTAGANNIVICGTRYYSQEVEEAANNPVIGTNVAYTLHYYANSHKAELRDKAMRAIQKGVALFVSEYGLMDANGNGQINIAESNAWWNFLEDNRYQISYVNWAVGNKSETSAMFTPGTNAGNLSIDRLTESGKLVRAQLLAKCNSSSVSGNISLSFTGAKTQFNFKDPITITASTTVSTGGNITKVDFYDGANLIGSSTTTPYNVNTSTLTPGGHDITAKSFTTGNILVATSKVYAISVVGASNISKTGVTDQFETSTQYSELTGGVTGTNCATANTSAAAGVYWFDDKDPLTPFKAEYRRSGNGKLRYIISQAAGGYNVVGFNFGEYCTPNGIRKYTLNLSANAILKLTVAAPDTNTVSLDLKFQLKDSSGTVLAFNKTVVPTLSMTPATSTWYKHEIGFSKNHPATTTTTYDYPALAPGKTFNFEYNFKDAITIKNPNSPKFPADINTTSAPFDFSKVVEMVIIPVNSIDDGDPTYSPLKFDNQVINFSGLQLGDNTLGADICSVPAAPGTVDKVYCQDATNVAALTATGIIGLTQKWYEGPIGGTASILAPIPSNFAASTTSYYVTQATSPTSTCESSTRSKLNVTFVAPSVSDAGTNQANASGPSIKLIANGPPSGTWALVSAPVGVTTVSFSPSALGASVTANGLSAKGLYTFSYSITATAPCTTAVSTVSVDVTTIASLTNDAYLYENVEIYPNPASDNLFVNLSKVNGFKSMKMMDMFGRVVYESVNQNSFNVDMSGLNKGMYIVQIQGESGKLSRSVIKQ